MPRLSPPRHFHCVLLGKEWGAAPYSGGFTIFLNYGTNGPLAVAWAELSTTAPFITASATNHKDGNWHHFAWTRGGNTHRLFLDGIQVAAVTSAAAFIPAAKNLTIGNDLTFGGGSRAYNGYIDDLRITKGVARYTANFTPPAQEFAHQVATANSTGHFAGDLQSVTNAAGHVTSYDLYDAAGRLLRMTDAKGIVTDISYTARGRVASVSVTPPGGTARVSSYTYDNAGQLTQASLPDGTSLGYSYDAAHRLTGVTDARGNSITYTLDSAGNRIGEDIRDPQGTLQRSITRSFDTLNRLQQITGAQQ